jgi:2-oxoglutarate ferredoxin oxidoreductase subunit alpha
MMNREEYEGIRKVLGESPAFAQGDIACAYGAVLAGCTFFAGYPITPATETAEKMAVLLPKIGGTYIQMEDEIASMGAIIGASWTGAKSMTTTSGPGFSLMQENIGYACMTETPCVIINVQRSGPSTGQPTEPAQGDMMQARWGSHGDYEMIALAPNSVQECLDLTLEAFNLAERYRNPVIVLTDGEVGHMREKIVIPEFEELRIVDREIPTVPREEYVPFGGGESGIPSMATFGRGYRTYVTGLTHTEKGLPATGSAEEHTKLVTRLCEKIRARAGELERVETRFMEDADYAVVCYGVSSRVALNVVRQLRDAKKKVGYVRMVGLWPFPEEKIYKIARQVKGILVPEMNLGQILHPVREAAQGECPVELLPKVGGEIHTPAEVMDAVEKLMATRGRKGLRHVQQG